jgi:targeting protein for Xklp2
MALTGAAGTPAGVKASVKKLTEPAPFRFRTTERLGDAAASAAAAVHEPVSTGSQSGSESTWHGGITTPRPFQFASESRVRTRAAGATASPSTAGAAGSSATSTGAYHSVAELVRTFQTKTPKRFRSKAAHAPPSPVVSSGGAQAHGPAAPTEPVEFHFAADARLRGPTVKSTAEREEAEMAAVPKFRARPLDRRVMQSAGDLGVPCVPRAAATRSHGVHFASDDRIRARHEREEAEEKERAEREAREKARDASGYNFRARPMPKNRRGAVPGRAAAQKRRGPTVAKTPNFASKKLPPRRRAPPKEATPKFRFRARPIPVTKTPVRKTSDKPLTDPVPFAVAEKPLHGAKFAQELAQAAELQRRGREFHARDAKVLRQRPMVVDLGAPRVTEPEPFALRTDARGNDYQREFRAHVDEELEYESEDARRFVARPRPAALDAPFFPARSARPLTAVDDFELNSDRRAAERAEFEAAQAAQAAETERRGALAAKERAAEEAREIKELRRSLVHKARPILRESAPAPQVAKRPLTEPKTPNLATKARASMRI